MWLSVAMVLLLCPPAAATPVVIESIDVDTHEGTTKVAIGLSRPADYRVQELAPDGQRPHRVYVDVNDARLPRSMMRQMPITESSVTQVRSGQFTRTKARVVLDFREPAPYRVETRRQPFRILLEVRQPPARKSEKPSLPPAPDPEHEQGQKEKAACELRAHADHSVEDEPRRASASLAFRDDHPSEPGDEQDAMIQLAPTFFHPVRIVIDPGHGGNDPGARSVEDTWEKDIVLGVAQELALRIRERLGVTVVLTRDSDETLSIAQRVARGGGDAALFLSLHANTSPRRWMRGVETFYSASGRYGPESQRLSHLVHRRVVEAIDTDYGSVRDGGVKKRGFGVLRRAGAPAILLEAAYISNPIDLARLADSSYRDATINGIVDGIADFLSGVPYPEVEVTRRKRKSPDRDLHVASHRTPSADRTHR
jgi:N-acetylmuramoyl-L-alanine amidase